MKEKKITELRWVCEYCDFECDCKITCKQHEKLCKGTKTCDKKGHLKKLEYGSCGDMIYEYCTRCEQEVGEIGFEVDISEEGYDDQQKFLKDVFALVREKHKNIL